MFPAPPASLDDLNMQQQAYIDQQVCLAVDLWDKRYGLGSLSNGCLTLMVAMVQKLELGQIQRAVAKSEAQAPAVGLVMPCVHTVAVLACTHATTVAMLASSLLSAAAAAAWPRRPLGHELVLQLGCRPEPQPGTVRSL